MIIKVLPKILLRGCCLVFILCLSATTGVGNEIFNAYGAHAIIEKDSVFYHKIRQYSSALINAKEIEDSIQIANSYFELGRVQQLQGKNTLAFDNYNRALTIYTQLDSKSGIANSMNFIGAIYRYGGSYGKAIEHHFQALNLYRELGDTLGEIKALNFLGIIYRNLDDYKKSGNYYQEALKLGAAANSTLLAEVYNSLGSYYWYQHKNDSALVFYYKALNFEPATLYLIEKRCAVLNNIGNVYRSMNLLDSASYYYKQSLAESRKYELSNLTAITFKNMAKVYVHTNKPHEALSLLDQSVFYAYQSNLANVLAEDYFLQAQIYKNKGMYKESLEKFTMYAQLKDSLLSEEKLRKITEQEVFHAIQKIENDKINLNKDIIEKDRQIKENRYFIFASVLIIVLLIVLAIFIFQRSITNKKMHQKIQLLNEELEKRVAFRTLSLEEEIEEHKKTEKELLKAKIKAEESDKLKSAFLSNMSHEIRTPMNAIIGFSELLSFSINPDNESIDYIDIIQSNSNKLLKLIDDIIDLSRIEANQINIEWKPCDVQKVLFELKSIYELKAKNTEVAIKLTLPKNAEALSITTDPFRLNQIMNNLLGNALKFTEKGYVEFGYWLDSEKEITFFVKDTGIGIASDKKNEVFKRFSRVEDTTDKIYGGTGLGLSICKELVELLHGKIWMDSELQKGSMFSFSLPINK